MVRVPMQQVKVFRTLSKLKRLLNQTGVSRLPFVEAGSAFVKQKWYGQFYGNSSERVLVDFDGMTLSFPQRFAHHYFFQDYEPLTQKAFSESLRPGMVVVDVGANIGYYTLLAARKVGYGGVVHAIEPSDENLRFLQENIRDNKLENVVTHSCAAGREVATRTFHITGSSDSHGFYNHPYTETIETVEMTQVPLDDLAKGRVDLVKIDVEGAEIEVLEGMRNIFAENKSLTLLLEWNPACMRNAGYDPLDLPAYLHKLGFDIQVLDDMERRVRSLEEVSAQVCSGTIPHFWYVNLIARRA